MHKNMIFMAGGLGRQGSYIAGTTVILQGRRRRPAGHGRTTFQETIKGKGHHLQKFAVMIIAVIHKSLQPKPHVSSLTIFHQLQLMSCDHTNQQQVLLSPPKKTSGLGFIAWKPRILPFV